MFYREVQARTQVDATACSKLAFRSSLLSLSLLARTFPSSWSHGATREAVACDSASLQSKAVVLHRRVHCALALASSKPTGQVPGL